MWHSKALSTSRKTAAFRRKALGWSATKGIRLVDLAISTGLLAPVDFGFRVTRRFQFSANVNICRFAVIYCKYLPICRNILFPSSANFELKLAIRALIGSANSGKPRSSYICLSLKYQGARVPGPRHFDCNKFSYRTWVHVADVHTG